MNKSSQNGDRRNGDKQAAASNETRPETTTLRRVMRAVEANHYEAALALLRDNQHIPAIRNARGVCLMRMGQFDEAIRVLRNLVLQPGCMWMMPEVPVIYKCNFATALLLGGLPSGCIETLAEIRDEGHPDVIRLRQAIKQWEAKLSPWQRLNWRIGRIEPANRPVQLDFPPGNFGVAETELPQPPQPASSAVRLHVAESSAALPPR